MKIQSLSIEVPNKVCMNHCKFCVSRMRNDKYEDKVTSLVLHNTDRMIDFDDYFNRLSFARDNGCNTVMLTGQSEPQQNLCFLRWFGTVNKQLSKPFYCIEMQTTGRLLTPETLQIMREKVGITTISLSISSLDDRANAEICGMGEGIVHLETLMHNIKSFDFNLRLSLNLTSRMEQDFAEHGGIAQTVDYLHGLGADQITFRVLYMSDNDTPQDRWIEGNEASADFQYELNNEIKENGKPLGRLSYGAIKYSYHGVCIVIDDDCMAQHKEDDTENYKYLILRKNCKLYSHWEDPASLIF